MLKKVKLLLKILLLLVVLSLSWYGIQRGLASGRQTSQIELTAIQSIDREATQLKVGAYNIAHGRGGQLGESNWSSNVRKHEKEHLTKIANQIADADLDVVILNEVDFKASWSGGIDQARFIAEAAGFRYVVESINIDIY